MKYNNKALFFKLKQMGCETPKDSAFIADNIIKAICLFACAADQVKLSGRRRHEFRNERLLGYAAGLQPLCDNIEIVNFSIIMLLMVAQECKGGFEYSDGYSVSIIDLKNSLKILRRIIRRENMHSSGGPGHFSAT